VLVKKPIMKSSLRSGVQCLLVLALLAGWGGGLAHGQSSPAAPAPAQPAAAHMDDATFLSTIGELRDAEFSDKEMIVEKLSQGGHPNVHAVLTAFLEDRLYFRNDDQ
jgi:hypothetical protein